MEKKYFNVKKKIEKSIMFFFEANSNIKKKLFEDAGRKLMEHFLFAECYTQYCKKGTLFSYFFFCVIENYE